MKTPEAPTRKLNLARIEGTIVLQKNLQARKRIVVNEGGTRSSKTYSLAQLFITKLFDKSGPPTVLTIARKTLPALRASAMRDVFNIMKELGVYDEAHHNKTENIYRQGRNELEFISVDEPQKVRGRKRDVLWMNEANEFTSEDFSQLIWRTTQQIFMDMNPVDPYHWIVEQVLPRDDVEYIHSTYRDNRFLEKEIVKEIERLQKADENYWRIYGLGLRGATGTSIYTHWKLVEALPENPDDVFYGIDFGYNNKTAVARVALKDQEYTWDELLYESGLTNRDLIEKLLELKRDGFITKGMIGYADAAEPDRIEELKRAGLNVRPADKSVHDGIDFVKSKALNITKRSINIQNEVKGYLWKTKDGRPLDEPVKENDHLMDACRYAAYSRQKAVRKQPNIRLL